MEKLKGIILDLDGVITQTARLHFLAWKETFDEYLRLREKRNKEPFREFTYEQDYLPYVDGKPRYEGVRGFLKSRGIEIEQGSPSDTPGKETVCGLGNEKNLKFNQIIKKEKPQVFPGTLKFIESAKSRGLKIGVASSSKNCRGILESCGLLGLFGVIVDGIVSEELSLKGKPYPDIFITAARNLGVRPSNCIVVEDAVSGVSAGRRGGFGLVVGIARKDNAQDLLTAGADIALEDLEYLDLGFCEDWFKKVPLPLKEYWDKPPPGLYNLEGKLIPILSFLLLNPDFLKPVSYFLKDKKRELLLFFDYDGTLTPIVEKPDLAKLDEGMHSLLKEVSKKFKLAIVSGRPIEEIKSLVGIKDIFYAGNHGFKIEGPDFNFIFPQAEKMISLIPQLKPELEEKLSSIEGVLIEDKQFSLAVHYRLVKEEAKIKEIRNFVKDILKDNPSLRLMEGKKVLEILPDIDWDKGKALRYIIQTLGREEDSLVVYLGDDTTDEDAFRVVRTQGLPILVRGKTLKSSSAYFYLDSPEEVKDFLKLILNS
ncbi:MAG: trehalose-phosphatase [Candidatus Omnitrophica bacterium]|nr:trehalose-phosphatase [Candidatus Omnitrophota bacterium]